LGVENNPKVLPVLFNIFDSPQPGWLKLRLRLSRRTFGWGYEAPRFAMGYELCVHYIPPFEKIKR